MNKEMVLSCCRDLRKMQPGNWKIGKRKDRRAEK